MAQFSYQKYVDQQAERKAANANNSGNRGQTTHFVNEFLKNAGDSVVVRFPYNTMDDIKFETTHTVTFPGEKFGKRVRCEDDNCPLCKQGIKLDTRFFVKAIVYVTDPTTGSVNLVPAIWDRPAAFADIELKTKMKEANEDFGTSLSNLLVRVTRKGSGLETKYDLSLTLNNNKAVYNPDFYKADFSSLESIDPSKILTKSIDQYMKALNPTTESPETTHTAEKVVEGVRQETVETPLGTQTYSVPVTETLEVPVTNPVNQENTSVPNNTDRPIKRYIF